MYDIALAPLQLACTMCSLRCMRGSYCLQDMVLPLQQALVMGLQQPPLAGAALMRLERWETSSSEASELTSRHIAQVASVCLA